MNSVAPQGIDVPLAGLSPDQFSGHLLTFSWIVDAVRRERVRTERFDRDAITQLLARVDKFMPELVQRAMFALPAKFSADTHNTRVPELPVDIPTIDARVRAVVENLDSLAHVIPTAGACIEHYHAVIVPLLHLRLMLIETLIEDAANSKDGMPGSLPSS
jgi:hypothetical protein